MVHLWCLLGGRDLSAGYVSDGLDAADRARVLCSARLEQRADWRVSRVLKRLAVQWDVDTQVRSLSHSGGCAAVLAATRDIRCGVDIERMRPRDFQALAGWVADEAEQAYLARTGWQVEAFYRLWCCKEALLKACDGDFPADMAKVGYRFDADGRLCGLRTDIVAGEWSGATAVMSDGMMVAAVWQGEADLRWRSIGETVLSECKVWPDWE